MKNNKVIREFGLSNLALNNRTSVLVIIFILVVVGLASYIQMAKENFPEIKIPEVYVGTAYPGNSPLDMENLVTRPLEKEINAISGVDEISSTSIQDYSSIQVKFDLKVDADKALQEVKDAVDKAKPELPNDLPTEPSVMKLDFGELPVMNINISGYDNVEVLKEYAEQLQDEIEQLSEITRVDIRGVQEKEVVINADVYELEARQLSFYDIENAISSENLTISGGDVLDDGVRRNVRVVGEFQAVDEIENVIIKNENFDIVYLKDVADVTFGYEEAGSYARTNQKAVVTLDVIKRSGANLINASDKIKEILSKNEAVFPEGLIVELVNDTSKQTKTMIADLENSIISGVILVVLVLLFFLGLRNALFVGIAIPLSMLMGFMILGMSGSTLNMMVLFSLILALGMLVDNGIVVVENIYRLMQEGMEPLKAAREGVGEVAMPIIASTATTLAAFVPLLFWNDIMGEFMKFLPLTLIIVLSSSLFVALVINPVLTSMFMKVEDPNAKTNYRGFLIWFAVLSVLSLLSYFVFGSPFFGGLFLAFVILFVVQTFIFSPLSHLFLEYVMPFIENIYKGFLRFVLKGWVAFSVFLLTIFLLVFSFSYMNDKKERGIIGQLQFPESEPNMVFIYSEYPIGTDISKTNALTQEIESVIIETLKPYDYMVEAVMANVGEGAGDPMTDGFNSSKTPNKSRVSVFFEAYAKRRGQSTNEVMNKLRANLGVYPGVVVKMNKEQNGPPTGPPINIEVIGEDYEKLTFLAKDIKKYLDDANVAGVDELKLDLEDGKPELLLDIDRDKARRFGLSTGRIASDIRTAVFGKEISKYKEGEDEYPINLRFGEEDRYDISKVLNQKMTFRNQTNGRMVQVPVSSVAKAEFGSTLGKVKRKDLDRMIAVTSNILPGYTSNEVNKQYEQLMLDYDIPDGYEVKFAGENKDQEESMAFLFNALIIAMFLIFLILVSQFNSIWTPIIILASVVFSTIGVFLGYGLFEMDLIVIMTGIGIVSLAGIVVNNAIVLIDYTNLVRKRTRKKLELDESTRLTTEQVKEAIVESGATRLRPVLLTAITTVLGLIPLAVGFNIDFYGLITAFEPNIFFGGDNVVFWGPMAWTVIFGLVFATFLTLVVVPVMYLGLDRIITAIFGKGINT